MAKAKIQISLEEELLVAVDEYCDKNFMNRSWLISQSLVQVLNQQKIIDAMVNVSVAIKNATENGVLDDETIKEIQNFETLTKMFLAK